MRNVVIVASQPDSFGNGTLASNAQIDALKSLLMSKNPKQVTYDADPAVAFPKLKQAMQAKFKAAEDASEIQYNAELDFDNADSRHTDPASGDWVPTDAGARHPFKSDDYPYSANLYLTIQYVSDED